MGRMIAYLPCASKAYSRVTAFSVTMVSPLGAKPQPPGPNALFSIRLYLISGRYMIPSGLISTSSVSSGARRISAASFEKGSTDRPWKDFVQSMCEGSSSCTCKRGSATDGEDGEEDATVPVVCDCGGEVDLSFFSGAIAVAALSDGDVEYARPTDMTVDLDDRRTETL